MARCGREIKAHQDDEGENVAHRHVVHVAKLRDTSVDPSDVVRAGFRGVISEHKTLLKTAGEELVRDGGTCQGYKRKISVQASEPQVSEPDFTRTKT